MVQQVRLLYHRQVCHSESRHEVPVSQILARRRTMCHLHLSVLFILVHIDDLAFWFLHLDERHERDGSKRPDGPALSPFARDPLPSP